MTRVNKALTKIGYRISLSTNLVNLFDIKLGGQKILGWECGKLPYSFASGKILLERREHYRFRDTFFDPPRISSII